VFHFAPDDFAFHTTPSTPKSKISLEQFYFVQCHFWFCVRITKNPIFVVKKKIAIINHHSHDALTFNLSNCLDIMDKVDFLHVKNIEQTSRNSKIL
jgi:hypothetical protein